MEKYEVSGFASGVGNGIDKCPVISFNRRVDEDKKDIQSEETVEDQPEEFRRVSSDASQVPSSGVYEDKRNGSSKPLLIILTIIVLASIGGAAFFLRNQFSTEEVIEPSPSTSLETPINEPSPSPESSFDRSEFTVRVLNGTTTSGLAASVSAKMKELGYQTGKTGNATSSAIKQTTVRVKVDAEGLSDQLIKDLSGDYDATIGTELKDSDDVDAEVIIGAK